MIAVKCLELTVRQADDIPALHFDDFHLNLPSIVRPAAIAGRLASLLCRDDAFEALGLGFPDTGLPPDAVHLGAVFALDVDDIVSIFYQRLMQGFVLLPPRLNLSLHIVYTVSHLPVIGAGLINGEAKSGQQPDVVRSYSRAGHDAIVRLINDLLVSFDIHWSLLFY